jgi:alkaline phosphatase
MGAGNPCFDNSGVAAGTSPDGCLSNYKYAGGPATWTDITDDGFVTGADADGDGNADDWTVIHDRADFQAMASGDAPARVLGIPNVYQTLQYNRAAGLPLIPTVPTLEEMTRAALNVLDDDEDGLFLMVEGGAVDWAGHGNSSERLIEEQSDFNRTVEAVVEWVRANSNWGETLVVVTGDHETGYLTGPGSGLPATWTSIVDNGAGILPGMQWNSGSHTNALIPFFAKGDAARLFRPYADERDPVRGRYLDNTELGTVLFEAMGVANPNLTP